MKTLRPALTQNWHVRGVRGRPRRRVATVAVAIAVLVLAIGSPGGLAAGGGTYRNPLEPAISGDGIVESCADPTVIRGQEGEGRWYLYCTSDQLSDQDLWRYIKYHAGGLRRSRRFWDPNLNWRENRAAFRYLDRGWHLGRSMDELAPCIGGEWPWYGIRDEDDLWEWMQRTRRC